jgi:flagellar basal body P-ring formation protein FlgA
MKHANCRSALIPTLLLLPLGASAQAVQSTAQIRSAAERFVARQLATGDKTTVIHVTAGELDGRLRLAPCEQPLVATLPQSARVTARVTIGVGCPQPRWTVYVPVTVETELQVLVLKQALARGSAVGIDDVEARKLRVPGLADTYIREPAQLARRHLKTAVAPGTALSVELLAADILVKRGQRVTLVAGEPGVEIRAPGEAVANATAEGRVRVMNLSSRHIVEGRVESQDLVRVGM